MTVLRAYINLLALLEIVPWFFQMTRQHLFVSPKKARVWDVLHCALWLTDTVVLPFHSYWHYILIGVWSMWLALAIRIWWVHRNDDDDDPPTKKKKLRAAASKVKAQLVERMKRLAPSPIPSPLGA